MNTLDFELKEVAAYPRFVIRGASGCWSRESGWVSRLEADIFDHDAKQAATLPVGGEWAVLAESVPVVGAPGADLRAKLGDGFTDRLGGLCQQNGLLCECEWSRGRRVGDRVLAGQSLLAKLAVPPSESKLLTREACEALSTELAEAVRVLVPEGVLVRPERLTFDGWNDMWNLGLVLVEAAKADFEDTGEVYPPEVPPAFALPEGASEDAARAWKVIVGLLEREGALDAEGSGYAFYTPEQWQARGEPHGEDGCLIAVHEGGAHLPYFALEAGAGALHARMNLALGRAGFRPEPGAGWFTVVAKKDTTEALAAALECRAGAILGATLTEGDDDDFEAKDLAAPTEPEPVITHMLELAGMRIKSIHEEPVNPGWGDLGKAMRIVTAIVLPNRDKPWTITGVARPELENLCRQVKSSLYEITGNVDIDWTSRWDRYLGWEVSWFIGDPSITKRRELGEAEDGDEDVGWKDAVPEKYLPTRADVMAAMKEELGAPTVLFWNDWHNKYFQGVWQPGRTEQEAAAMASRIVRRLNLRKGRGGPTSSFGYRYYPEDGSLDLAIRHELLAEGLDAEDEEGVSWKEVTDRVGIRRQNIEQALLAAGARRVTWGVTPQAYVSEVFSVEWFDWNQKDMERAVEAVRQLGLTDRPAALVWAQPIDKDHFELKVPKNTVVKEAYTGESQVSGLVLRIIESGGIVRRVQETGQEGTVRIQGEWRATGDALGTLAESLAQVTRYDSKTGRFSLLTSQQGLAENSVEGDDRSRVAIVAVFREKADGEGHQCLVCKREYPPAEGEWVIPGGHAEEGEEIKAAALREMVEETHLELGDLTFIKKMPNETGKKEVTVYGTFLPEGEKAKAGDDAERLKWVDLDDLPPLGLDNDKLVREIARKMELLPTQEGLEGGEEADWKDAVGDGEIEEYHGWVFGPKAGEVIGLAHHPSTNYRFNVRFLREEGGGPDDPQGVQWVYLVELRHDQRVLQRREMSAANMQAVMIKAADWVASRDDFRTARILHTLMPPDTLMPLE